ncbi:MAG: YhdP family protein, partial [Burkholderiales bacterium]
ERVTIGQIGARWQGMHPELELSNVNVHDKAGNIALTLPAVEAVIGWRSLLFLSLRLHSLVIDQPDLDIRRDANGRLFVAGMELRSEKTDAGAGDWLLSQNEIVIRNARLAWSDERREAAKLVLSGVTMMLQNSGDTHRFALRAQTERALASALDVRGEFIGESLTDLGVWRGRVFAELDYVDLAAWKPWVDYPFDLDSGKGALRLWLASDGERITELTADVALANVRARLAADLPMLNLDYLNGRLGGSRGGAKELRTSLRAFGSKLTLKSTGGAELPPADFSLRWDAPVPGTAEKGELQANALELEPLANLLEFLPISKEARAKLVAVAPRGAVHDMKFAWSGNLEKPDTLSIRGRFAHLDLKSPEGWGGFAGLSGELNATKSSGSLKIDSTNTQIELPRHLPEGRARFDKVTAQIGWNIAADGNTDVKFSNLSLVNGDGIGNLAGTYTTRSRHAKSPGVLDLTGQFPRADAKMVYRYIPHLPKPVIDYLKDAIVAGQGSEGRLRFKGDLRDFPYADEKVGIFKVSAHVSNGEFRYAEGWPILTEVAADLNFDGRRMQVLAPRATVLGTRAANVRVQIPDLYGGDERVLIDGQGEGASADYLRFIESSPITRYIDGATKGIRGTGTGRLQLKLDIPVQRLAQTKVVGEYQVLANNVDIEGGVPPLNLVNGRIEFSESGMSARGLTGQMLGGQVTASLASKANGALEIEAQGSAMVSAAAKFFELPLLDRANGSANWRGNIRVGKEGLDLSVDSALVGVAIALPEPMNKSAPESLPFRLEYSSRADAELLRRVKAPRLTTGGDAFSFSLGTRANAVFMRRKLPTGYQLDRGAVGVGEPPPPMDRGGVSISGKVEHLDADRWRAVFDSGAKSENLATNLNIEAGTLDFVGRRLHQVRLRAAPVGTAWAATLASREMSGSLTWRPEGAGRVVARLKHFTVPDAPPGPLPAEIHSTELPALDIVADSFTLGDKRLGKLELVAVNEVRDWRIEKLTLTSEDGVMGANGVWQSWAQRPSVSLSINLDLSNVGGFLDRMGFPGTMKGGNAKMGGKIGWVGSPQTIDFPSLTGNLSLTAANGQFLKAEPGIAKLLGILSMQTWITLDFRGLFGEGFSFDTISSSANINKGIVVTEDFAMAGRTAKVSMAGTINLAQETQNLKVRVVPSIGDGASSIVALTVANPAIGLIALLLQRVLGDPVGKIFAFDYTVLGTWTDPKVERTNIETPPGLAQVKKE